MSQDPLAKLCIARLTRLLELNTLEDLKILEYCSYVTENIELGDCDFKKDGSCYKGVGKIKKLFYQISKRDSSGALDDHHHHHHEDMLIKCLQLIEYLGAFADSEGLFRISGSKKRQEELKDIINKGACSQKLSQYTPHDIASVLKQFLGALGEPLLTKQLYECYQQIAGKLKELDDNIAKQRKIDALKFLFLLLPPLNRLLLQKLLILLANVASQTTSKMTAYNLGVVFAPNIICIKKQLGCLSECIESFEPFTDLVRFLIENEADIFKVPDDFIQEAKGYLQKISQDELTDSEVPLFRTYCKKIDNRQYRQEAKDHTNNALMMLYAQVMDMPDGSVKTEFIEKFRQSYPGTPLFLPKSIREKQVANSDKSGNHSTPTSPVPTRNCPAKKQSVKKAVSEPSLTSPIQKSFFKRGGMYTTPKASLENIDICHKVSNTPSTPSAKMKECFKKIRQRSVDMFKSRPRSSSLERTERQSPKLDRSNTDKIGNRLGNIFRRSDNNRFRHSVKYLKKSISTPVLSSRKRDSYTSDEDELEENIRKLSFTDHYNDESVNSPTTPVMKSPELPLKLRVTTSDKKKDRPVSYPTFRDTSGLINYGFLDSTTESASTGNINGTPLIKKTLYPFPQKKILQDSLSSHHAIRNNENIPPKGLCTPFIKASKHPNGIHKPSLTKGPFKVENKFPSILGDITNAV